MQTRGAATKARMRECPNEGKTRTEAKALPQDERMVDTPPQKDEHQHTEAQTQGEYMVDTPPCKGERKRSATPQGSPNSSPTWPRESHRAKMTYVIMKIETRP